MTSIKSNRYDNCMSYVIEDDALYYNATFQIIKKGNHPYLIKAYGLKQNGHFKVLYNTGDYTPFSSVIDMMNKEIFMRHIFSVVELFYSLKKNSFIQIESIIVEPNDIYIDMNMTNIKFICLPIYKEISSCERVEFEKRIIYAISYFIYYSKFIKNNEVRKFYDDCQSGLCLLDDIHNMICEGKYGIVYDDENKLVEDSQHIFVILRNQDDENDTIIVNNDNFIIGRSKEKANYTMRVDGVSRRHFSVISQDNKIYIKDLGSTNGTWVNGTKIFPDQLIPISNGMTVSLAGITYIVEC